MFISGWSIQTPSVILKKVWNSNSYWIMISYHVIDILQFLLNVIWTHGQDNLWLFLYPYTLGSVFDHPSPKVTKAGDIKIDTDMLKYCFDQQTLPLGSYYNDA